MQLKTPTNLVFWISVVLAVLALLGSFVAIPFVSTAAIWFILIAFVLLALGVTLPGL